MLIIQIALGIVLGIGLCFLILIYLSEIKTILVFGLKFFLVVSILGAIYLFYLYLKEHFSGYSGAQIATGLIYGICVLAYPAWLIMNRGSK